jgi:DNA-binding NarL/FixJ family response regulator
VQKRILLADDHAEARQATRLLLENRADWVICGEADNGFDAVEKAATLKPDIVILDLSMPKMNGLEAAKIIHTASPSLPLLLFSINAAYTQAPDTLRASGFRGAVSKATGWLLADAVEMLLQGKTFLNGSALVTTPLIDAEALPDANSHAADEPQNAKQAAAGADDSSSKPPVA